jgi:hypothetical protein
MEKSISICIPRLEKKITKQKILNTFKQYNWGIIHKIDLITIKNYKRAFIHYKTWYNNEQANNVKNYLLNNLDIKIIYDAPWYWICRLNYKS